MDFKVPQELVDSYLINRRGDIEILRELLVSKKFDLIAAKGHNIKGNAASFGFADLGLIAKEMEEAALKKHEQSVFQCILSMEEWLKSSTMP